MVVNESGITRRQAVTLGVLTLGLSFLQAARADEVVVYDEDGPVWLPVSIEWKLLSADPKNNYHETIEYDDWGNAVTVSATMDDGWANVARYEYDQDGNVTSYHVDAVDSVYDGQWSYEYDDEGRISRATCDMSNGMSPQHSGQVTTFRYRDGDIPYVKVTTDELLNQATSYEYDGLGRVVLIERVENEDDDHAARKSVLGFLWQHDTDGRTVGFIEVLLVFDRGSDGAYVSAGQPYAVAYDVDVDEHGNMVKISEVANELTIGYKKFDSPTRGARSQAAQVNTVLTHFQFANVLPSCWYGHNPPFPERRLLRVDASKGARVTLGGTVVRRDNSDAGAWQEIFYMLKLDDPVEFTGLGNVGPSTAKTDEVKVAGAINLLSMFASIPLEKLAIPEWEERVGKRVECTGRIVGMMSPHYAEVNMLEVKVLE